jgi:hypothetical protein
MNYERKTFSTFLIILGLLFMIPSLIVFFFSDMAIALPTSSNKVQEGEFYIDGQRQHLYIKKITIDDHEYYASKTTHGFWVLGPQVPDAKKAN